MPETIEKQTQGLVNYSPTLYKENGSKLIQYNPIAELSELFSLLSASDTSTAYQKAAEKTWLLLKKTIVLLLFVFCLIVAMPIWVSGIGFQMGFKFREWLEKEQPSLEQIISRILDFVAYPFKQAYAWANWFVKQYLNWEVSFDPARSTAASTAASTSNSANQ